MSKQVDASQRRRILLCTILVLELTLLNGLISNALSSEGARPFLPLLNLVGYTSPTVINLYPGQLHQDRVEITIRRAATGEDTTILMAWDSEGFLAILVAYANDDMALARGLLAKYLHAGDEIVSIAVPASGGPRPQN